jgi:RNA polymerase sigma factor (TIGR02999 family)
MEELYDELRAIAGQLFRHERPDHTLQPTALINEAYIRLCKHGPKKYQNRAHFFGVISRTMRQILIDHARKRATIQRGKEWKRIPFEEAELVFGGDFDFLAFDGALTHLSRFDQRLSQIAELRFFCGLSAREVAEVLGRGESTIRKDWSIAKAWLQRDLAAPTI